METIHIQVIGRQYLSTSKFVICETYKAGKLHPIVFFGSCPPPSPLTYHSTFLTSLLVFLLSVWRGQFALASLRKREGGFQLGQIVKHSVHTDAKKTGP
jgi:hypothetical protein